MKRLVAGNWKMMGTKVRADALTQAISLGVDTHWNLDVLIFPPFVYLERVSRLLLGKNVFLGAQDVSAEPSQGAFTGQISADMLVDSGCRYVLVGHSERRALCGETSEQVASKCVVAQAAGLIPIVCVGENSAERATGKTEAVIQAQLQPVLELGALDAPMIVAYEPVWAIGTGLSATPEQVDGVHRLIHQWVGETVAVLYGGSVKANNAQALLAQPSVNGCLVGGASLEAAEFLAICERAVS